MSSWPSSRTPHRINDQADRSLAVHLAAEVRSDESPDVLRDLDDETVLLLAFRLVRVARIAGWRPTSG